MWVPELLLPPKIIMMFGPKTAIFALKYAFLGSYRPCRLIWCPVGWWLWRAGCISQDTYLLYDKDSLRIKKKIDVECFQDFDVNLEN